MRRFPGALAPLVVNRTFTAVAGAGGGGGGSLVAVRRARNTAGDVAAPNTASAWQLVASTGVSLPATAGDYVELNVSMMVNSGSSVFLDWVVVVGGSIVRAASSDTATPLSEGWPAFYPTPNTFRTVAGPMAFTTVPGDLDGSSVVFQLAVKAAGTGTIYRSATYPIILTARNYGVVDDGV